MKVLTLTTGLTALLASGADAQVTLVEQERDVGSWSDVALPLDPQASNDLDEATGFGPFAATVVASVTRPPFGTATSTTTTQTSLGPDRFSFEGSVQLDLDSSGVP